MTSLLFTSNRSYLKFSIPIVYRHLSWMRNSSSNHREKLLVPNVVRVVTLPSRSVTLHVPPSVEDAKSKVKIDPKAPFQFPPGKPTDRPRLEHLRFIEEQLKQILPEFFKRMHPYALYTADLIFENYYDEPAKVIKGVGGYALAIFWIRTKLNFKLMNITVRLLQTTVDEESDCVKIRWRISGLSNQSFIGILKGWRKPKDVAENVRDYIEHIDGLSTFYVRGDGRIYKHRIDRVMVDENKEAATASPLTKKKLPATAPVS